MRGLVNAGALERVEIDADQPYPNPEPDFAPPELNGERQMASASLTAAVGQGFDPVLLDGVTGSGKTEFISKPLRKRFGRRSRYCFAARNRADSSPS